MTGPEPCSVVRPIGRRTTDQQNNWSADQRGPGPDQPDQMSVRFIRADVKVPKPRRGFDVLTVSWLPDEGWTCDCRRKTCDHLKAVKEALT